MDKERFKAWAKAVSRSVDALDEPLLWIHQSAKGAQNVANLVRPFDAKAASIVEAISGKLAEATALEKDLINYVKSRSDKSDK